MDNAKQKKYEIEINIGDIISHLLSKIVIIVLVGVIFAIFAILGTKIFITPKYQSVTKMYVLTQQDGGAITSADMQTSSYLTKDYVELVKSRTVAENVIKKLNLEEMSYDDLQGKLTVYAQADTRIVTIVVTDENPERACKLADTVREESAEQIKKVMNSQSVNVVDVANVPTYPVSPNVMKNGLLGAAFGVCLTVAIILLRYLLNSTIQTADDVEKYLNLSTLGTIPMSNTGNKSKKKKKVKRLKRRK